MKFPRFGCVFCVAHSELRSTHNTHLDSMIKEVTNARAITPAVRKGQHFLPIVRAVRRRSGRNKNQRPIAIKTSEYDCCDKWRLFVMINDVAELQEFETRVLPSVAEWTAIADSFVAHRAERTQRRLEYDDSDLNTDTDNEDGFIPALPSSTSSVRPRATASASRPVRKSTRRTRYVVDSDSDLDARATPAGITITQQRHAKSGPNIIQGTSTNPVVNYTSIDLGGHDVNRTTFVTATPTRRPRVSPMSLLTPPPRTALDALHEFDLPTPPAKKDITLCFREIGRVVLPAGMTLGDAVQHVGARVRIVLGPDSGEVLGFRDARGVVKEAMWVRKTAAGEEWKVALEWAW